MKEVMSVTSNRSVLRRCNPEVKFPIFEFQVVPQFDVSTPHGTVTVNKRVAKAFGMEESHISKTLTHIKQPPFRKCAKIVALFSGGHAKQGNTVSEPVFE